MKLFRSLPSFLLFAALFIIAWSSVGQSQGKNTATGKSKTPPLLVTTVEADEGAIQAMADFIGTTYFARVSEVATDIEGLVRRIQFDEGDRVNKGDLLVMLDSELLESEIIGARAAFEQNQVDLENAGRDFERIEALYNTASVSETDYDSYRARKMRLEKNANALEAKHNSLLIAKNKKSIYAPFSGIVLDKAVEEGEWVAKGGKVAVVADNSRMDVWVEVPMDILNHLEPGRRVAIRIGDREFSGEYTTYIPKGDLATRTFSAKFSLEKSSGLAEGLEALVSLPKGGENVGLLVPRDAIVDKYGKTMIFLAVDSKARMVPVDVAGYVGLQAVVTGEGLAKGQQVIVKGSKRVEDEMDLQFR